MSLYLKCGVCGEIFIPNTLKQKYCSKKCTVQSTTFRKTGRVRPRIPKNYYKSKGKFRICKMLNGKNNYYGCYDTEEEAKQVVKYLKEHNWDKSSLNELNLLKQKNKEKDLLRINERNYYYLEQGKYAIKKRINGKCKYFGRYDTEEEAQEVVEHLKKNNWNKECLKV